MRDVCEHVFLAPNRSDPAYSGFEFPLESDPPMRVRKDIELGHYEIVHTPKGVTTYLTTRFDLVVRHANKMERRKEIRIACGPDCPRRRSRRRARGE